MIRDAENTFFYKKDLNGTTTSGVISDVIAVGKGNAVLEQWLDVSLQTKLVGGNAAVTLQTASDEAFTTPVDLLSVTATTSTNVGKILQSRIPQGILGYLRVKVVPTTALTAGKITAVLLVDSTLQ